MRVDFFSDKNILFKNVKAEILRNFKSQYLYYNTIILFLTKRYKPGLEKSTILTNEIVAWFQCQESWEKPG